MLTIVVEIVDGLVGHQVVVVEEQSVDTQTKSQLQVVENVPVVLQIDTQFVELHAGSGLLLTIVTVGQGHNLRIAVEEQ